MKYKVAIFTVFAIGAALFGAYQGWAISHSHQGPDDGDVIAALAITYGAFVLVAVLIAMRLRRRGEWFGAIAAAGTTMVVPAALIVIWLLS